MEYINHIGITNFRDEFQRFGIKIDDRRRHMYLVGKSGTGKTTMMENMVIQDINNNKGVCVIDPHGESINRILYFIPENRIKDVIYFNPGDIEFPIAFNVIEEVPIEHRHLVVAGLMGVFKKIWPDVWSARMEYILNNALLALLECPEATLLSVNRLLSDEDFRKAVMKKVTDSIVKSFWEREFANYNVRFATEAIAPIQNKVGQFISNPLIRNIIGQKGSKIDIRQIMDEGKILLANLSKGMIGEDNSSLLGALLVTKIQLAAMSRIDIPEEQRKDFYLYVDEFQNFSTESFASIFAEARKYRLDLTLAHQYIAQLNEQVKDSIFGNIGTLVSFRLGPEDAELLEKYFAPEFTKEDLINLPNYNFYIKLMIDGVLSKSFSAMNIPPCSLPKQSFIQEIIQNSRDSYAALRHDVEDEIAHWGLLDFSPSPKNRDFKNKKIGVKDGWEAVCSQCGKRIIVPFQPDPNRSVYCDECFKEIRTQRGKNLTHTNSIQHTQSKIKPKKEEMKEVIKNIFRQDT